MKLLRNVGLFVFSLMVVNFPLFSMEDGGAQGPQSIYDLVLCDYFQHEVAMLNSVLLNQGAAAEVDVAGAADEAGEAGDEAAAVVDHSVNDLHQNSFVAYVNLLGLDDFVALRTAVNEFLANNIRRLPPYERTNAALCSKLNSLQKKLDNMLENRQKKVSSDNQVFMQSLQISANPDAQRRILLQLRNYQMNLMTHLSNLKREINYIVPPSVLLRLYGWYQDLAPWKKGLLYAGFGIVLAYAGYKTKNYFSRVPTLALTKTVAAAAESVAVPEAIAAVAGAATAAGSAVVEAGVVEAADFLATP